MIKMEKGKNRRFAFLFLSLGIHCVVGLAKTDTLSNYRATAWPSSRPCAVHRQASEVLWQLSALHSNRLRRLVGRGASGPEGLYRALTVSRGPDDKQEQTQMPLAFFVFKNKQTNTPRPLCTRDPLNLVLRVRYIISAL